MSRVWTILQAVAISYLIVTVINNAGSQLQSDRTPPKDSHTVRSGALKSWVSTTEEMKFHLKIDNCASIEHDFLQTLSGPMHEKKFTVDLSECIRRNETLIIAMTVVARGRQLTKTLQASKSGSRAKLRNLFDGEDHEETEAFYRVIPEVEFLCIDDMGSQALPNELRALTVINDDQYFPICTWNEFWNIDSAFVDVNSTNVNFNVSVAVRTSSMWKFLLLTQLDNSFSQHEGMGTMGRKEIDEIKRIFVETNPWLLGLTMIVSMVHLLFEYLAFSNDVQFWKGRKSFKGLSVKSLALNCYFSTVIFLYLLDGETSWTVLAPSGVGVLIEFWKLTKAASVSWKSGLHITFSSSYSSKTQEHDDKAMKFLLWLMFPSLFVYSIYSAVYDSHKGWFSFVVGVQVRFIYFFGFAMMTPQIFINYKLKSVTHLPWRTFVYKALNTFIDDLFAFVIKMPTMHRLACFRDDIIFLILLYQRWIYPTDASRTTDDEDQPEVAKIKED